MFLFTTALLLLAFNAFSSDVTYLMNPPASVLPTNRVQDVTCCRNLELVYREESVHAGAQLVVA